MGERHRFEDEWAELKTEWSKLPREAKRTAWDRYTSDLDEGSAGWNRYHLILWPAYELGDRVLTEALE